MVTMKAKRVHPDVVAEMRSMAETIRASGEDADLLDAGYLESAAAKLLSGEPLSDNEREVVVDELENWRSKDAYRELDYYHPEATRRWRRRVDEALKIVQTRIG